MRSKNTHPKTKKSIDRVIVTPKMQKWFLIFLSLNWIATLATPFINVFGRGFHVDKGFLVYAVLQSLLPILFGLCTVPFAWRHYTGLLHRFFMTGFIGLIGLITYGALSSVESAVRYRWFVPHEYVAQPGFWQSYSHDIIFMALSLAAYVCVLGLWDYRLIKRTRK